MARRPSVRYWKSRSAYCCWIRRKQYVLAVGPDDWPDGPTYKAAQQAYWEKTSLANADQTKDATPVKTVCELFLRHVADTRRSSTLHVYQSLLVPFGRAMDPDGKVPAKALTTEMVRKWLATMSLPRSVRSARKSDKGTVAWEFSWGPTTRSLALGAIRAAFRWAAGEGAILMRNPLQGLRTPTPRSRGIESLIGRTADERAKNHQRILAASPKHFRPLIVCLEATGARPSELAYATAADYDAGLGAIVYHADDTRLEGAFQHKTSGHGKSRMIFLTGEAKETVERLCKEQRRGPIFRTRRGKPRTVRSIGETFRGVRKKVGLPHLTAYSYRHTFATAWLERSGGRDIDALAAILGNTPEIIRRHYSHLLGDPHNLRARVEAFRNACNDSQRDAGPASPSSSDTGPARLSEQE